MLWRDCYRQTLGAHNRVGERKEFSMRWFRSHIRAGSRLALFALAVQFCLAFGHLHPQDLYGSAQRPLTNAAEIALPRAESPESFSANYAADRSDDFCAICETIFMLGSSATPEPPKTLTPALIIRPAQHFARTAALFIAPRRGPFQSRAPPVA